MIRRARPSKPGRPVAKCDDGIYMTVEWTQPEDDGDGDITGYIIKYGAVEYLLDYEHSIADGDENTNVDDYATVKVAGNTTSFQFSDQLKHMTIYQFAVAAVNTAGQGEFSDFSEDFVYTWPGQHRHN